MLQRINSLFRLGLLLTIFFGKVAVAAAQSSESLYDLVELGAAERIATGFIFTEGPVGHPDGYLLFSDVVRNRIYRWTPDGRVVTFRSPSGNSNGLTFDMKRRLISCEQGNRQVLCTEADGSIVVLASRYDRKKLNSPKAAEEHYASK